MAVVNGEDLSSVIVFNGSALTIGDDVLWRLGTDGDQVLVNNSAGLAANAEVTSLIVGTSVHPATAANSLIISNVTAAGDILLVANRGGNSESYLFVDSSAGTLDLMTVGVSRMFFGAAGLVAIGDTSNPNMTIGLTINQGAADDQAFALKSSDVAHGLTTAAYGADVETDDYFVFGKAGAASGGVTFKSLANDTAVTEILSFQAYGGTATTTKSTAGVGLVNFYISEHNGANALADITADGNVFSITVRRGGADAAVLIVDEDGDQWLGGGIALIGKASIYANVTTAGWGVGAIYSSSRATAQEARSAALATYTVGAADGTFLVSANVLVTTSTTHSFSVDVDYTDEGNTARTLILPMAQLAGTFITGGLITNVTGAGPYESAVLKIRCKAATAITIRPSAGTFTTVTYNAEADITQVA